MPKLELTNINLPELMIGERLASYVQRSPQQDFNAHIVFYEKKNSVFFIMKDISTFLHFPIQCAINTDIEYNMGLSINPDTFFYIFKSYSDEELKSLHMTLELNNETQMWQVKVETSTDHITIPNAVLIDDMLDELINDINNFAVKKTNTTFNLSDTPNKADFLRGVSKAFEFIGVDVKVHNAVSIFSDRVVVNDNRHIYVYTLEGSMNGLSDENYIPLHKTGAAIVNFLYQKKTEFNLIISSDSKYCWIDIGDNSGICLNNSMSVVSPPTKDKLLSWKAENKVCTVSTFKLKESIDFFFFKGFFAANDQWKPILLSVTENGIVFEIKNTSSISNACNVKREIPATIDSYFEGQSWIISDSLSMFLKSCVSKNDSDIDLTWDMKSKAVHLKNGSQEIYLGKLQVRV